MKRLTRTLLAALIPVALIGCAGDDLISGGKKDTNPEVQTIAPGGNVENSATTNSTAKKNPTPTPTLEFTPTPEYGDGTYSGSAPLTDGGTGSDGDGFLTDNPGSVGGSEGSGGSIEEPGDPGSIPSEGTSTTPTDPGSVAPPEVTPPSDGTGVGGVGEAPPSDGGSSAPLP